MKPKSKQTSSFGLRGVGPAIEKHLARMQIYSPQDLLLHLPLRYQDRTRVQAIRQLKPGEEAVIEGEIKSITKPPRGRTKLLIELQDGTGKLFLRFFHGLSYQSDVIKTGTRLRCYHQVQWGPKGLEMVHPEFQVVADENKMPVDQHLTPIYPATEGLSQYMLRKLTANALNWMMHPQVLNELLPESLLKDLSFPTLKQAIHFIHRPPCQTPIEELLENKTLAQKRLITEELIAHRLSLLRLKKNFQSQTAIPFAQPSEMFKQFKQRLPFQLTQAQHRVAAEICQDLAKPYPMLRLVQGDVGSGKTVIAALAMLQAVENGYQAAMMAPTELLAEQHYRVFKRWFEPLGIHIVFLSGSITATVRNKTLKAIQDGAAQIVLGTHALFQEGVTFSKLALVVVDEQHRFGVHQRALFREKGKSENFYPHQLVMTATPIPRTLAMSFYADLDCSVIDELPPGRTPITTSVVASSRREEVIQRIRETCQKGHQVYWVCPLIDESEVISAQSAMDLFEQLKALLPELTIDLVHGRMRSAEKDKVMQAFQQGQVQVLVATTVIEVGVDVPNASVMVIENAERMGLSQLHQLRGRVGRGAAASFCVLFYQYPLSNVAKERLSVMRETNDGFKIAQRDLELRGPGEMLGTRQTGELTFRVSDLLRDNHLLSLTQNAADKIISEYPHLVESLIHRWLRGGKEYGKV